MRPNRRVKLLHKLACSKGDIRAARHHPLNNAYAAGENHGALGSALPKRPCNILRSKGKHIGKGDNIRGVGVVNNPVLPVCRRLADAVVHKVTRELAGGSAALFKTPNNTVAVARVIDFNNANIVLRG